MKDPIQNGDSICEMVKAFTWHFIHLIFPVSGLAGDLLVWNMAPCKRSHTSGRIRDGWIGKDGPNNERPGVLHGQMKNYPLEV